MRTRTKPVQATREAGFTLIEVLASVALVSLVAAYLIHMQIQQFTERMVESLAQDVMMAANVSVTYFTQSSKWPDQDNDCANIGADPDLAKVLPFDMDDYEGMDGVSLQTDCTQQSDLGRVLMISVEFPQGATEQASMLLSYLPASKLEPETKDAGAIVTHYVPGPRKASSRFNFYRIQMGNYGIFDVPKPACPASDSDPAYMLLPQAICKPGLEYGLGGFYFKDITSGGHRNDHWTLQLMVADGNNNTKEFHFGTLPQNATCDGDPVYVGAITYCEARGH